MLDILQTCAPPRHTLDIIDNAERASLIYSLLPHLIQKRTGRIPSLRRTISHSGNTSHQASSDSGCTTLPPPYRTLPGTPSKEDEGLTALWMPSPSKSAMSTERGDAVASRRHSSSREVVPLALEESRSGVGWRYANEGCTLLTRSVREASSPSQELDLARSLYIDGMVYLLRGLPSDMSREERLRLRSASPTQLELVPQLGQSSTTDQPQSTDHEMFVVPSLLRRLVAKIVLCIILIIQFALPYVQLFARQAYRYDRKYNISDRLLARSITAADSVGQHTMTLANRFLDMNDGKIREAVRELGIWWVQVMVGGIYDGLGQGLDAIGVRVSGASDSSESVVSKEEDAS